MKEPTTGTKIRTTPATMPGMRSGSDDRANSACSREAPRRARGLDQRVVDRLQREVAGQDHVGQVGVHQADDDRRIGEQQVDFHGRTAESRPLPRSTIVQEKMRTSPLLQNGRMISRKIASRLRPFTMLGQRQRGRIADEEADAVTSIPSVERAPGMVPVDVAWRRTAA